MIWNPGVWVLRWQTADGINMEAPFQTEYEGLRFYARLGQHSQESSCIQRTILQVRS